MKRRGIPSKKALLVFGVLILSAALCWLVGRFGLFGGPVVGLDLRPWRRPTASKPIGVRVEPLPVPASPAGRRQAGAGRLAIILDDWGMSQSHLDDVIALRRPITLSILPHLPHSADIARVASANSLGVMLHMPMQAKSRGVAKEDEIITIETPDVRIRRYLDEAIASIPSARGVNNHQGSAATSDPRVMRTVLTHLKKKDLFFVDSFVIATTAGPETAKEIGIPFAKRDIFIDNVAEIEPIKVQLRKAIKKALQNKTAIAIGHDKSVTLLAISQMIPEIEKAGVQLVLVEELVQA